MNLLIAHPTGLAVEEPLFLISNRAPDLDLVWSYVKRFRHEQLFRDQNPVCSSWQKAVCGIRCGSTGCSWWSRSLSWQAFCNVIP